MSRGSYINKRVDKLEKRGGNIIMLAIETSCDDTCIAIVSGDGEILSSEVYAQIDHSKYGGVIPEYASRAHLQQLPNVLKAAMDRAQCEYSDITHIAVTTHPGLIGSLIAGQMFARGLSDALNIPYIMVNHLVGHALSPRLQSEMGNHLGRAAYNCDDGARDIDLGNQSEIGMISFPYLLALLSGGHCQLILMNSATEHFIIGETMDDALGEVFDKIARMLGFEYPGGKYLEKAALGGDEKKFALPMPLCNTRDKSAKECNFSFSGLKTAALRIIETHIKDLDSNTDSEEWREFSANLSASFQYTVSNILKLKLSNAISKIDKEFGINCKNIAIAGGVASNKYLRDKLVEFAEHNGLLLHFPPIRLCTDNAAMIAWAAIEEMLEKEAQKNADKDMNRSNSTYDSNIYDEAEVQTFTCEANNCRKLGDINSYHISQIDTQEQLISIYKVVLQDRSLS